MALTKQVYKFGRNPDIDTTTDPEDIWDGGGVYSWPSAAAVTTVVSSSTDDAAAGTGMRTVTIQGLDSNWNFIEETATLTGTDAVTLTNQYLRVFRCKGVTAGSGATNAGNVQVKHGATVLAQITAGNGQTLMALYTVPADFIGAKILGVRANVVTKVSTGATVYLFTRDNANANPIWRVRDVIGASESAPIKVTYPVSPITVGPKTDIRLYVQAVTANDTDIAGAFWLEQLSDS